jgi:hypothetical protein
VRLLLGFGGLSTGHRLAQVGAPMERHDKRAAAASQTAAWPAELSPSTTATREAPESCASGGPAAWNTLSRS